MIFVTGPLYSGKQDYIRQRMGWSEEQLAENAVRDAQELAGRWDGSLEELADRLAEYPAVIAAEVGGGVVPTDPEERRCREAAGRLACLLAQRAEETVRVFCGIPTVLNKKQNGTDSFRTGRNPDG